jgi:GNAT superfamily N-acetyltransferase
MMNTHPELIIKNGYIPGSIGRISELHGTYYHDHWDFGVYFEAKVATELSDFLNRFNKDKDGIWLATVNGRIEGSIIIDGSPDLDKGAHLRWFIISDAWRGKGAGRKLINAAIDFCRSKAYQMIYLWTFAGLNAARYLYEDVGFKLIKQQSGIQWGTEVNEQYFELRMNEGIIAEQGNPADSLCSNSIIHD